MHVVVSDALYLAYSVPFPHVRQRPSQIKGYRIFTYTEPNSLSRADGSYLALFQGKYDLVKWVTRKSHTSYVMLVHAPSATGLARPHFEKNYMEAGSWYVVRLIENRVMSDSGIKW